MKFSIVVVTWQSATALERLVASLNRHLDGRQELIVVDNASEDDPAAVAAGWQGPGWFLRMDRNLGFGAAANGGVARASNEGVVLLNPDTWLLDDGVERLAELALRLRALVGPAVRSPDGSLQPSASGPPVGVWPWVRAVLPSKVGSAWILRRTAPWRLGSLTPVAWLTGVCVAAPRRTLLELGPFDPAIHMYGEDLDLGLRARLAGTGSYLAPHIATIVHEGKASTVLAFDDLGRAQAARNGRAVLRRRYGARKERAAWLADVANVAGRVAAKRLARRDPSWERTVLAGLVRARRVPELPAPGGSRPRPPEPLSEVELVPSGGPLSG